MARMQTRAWLAALALAVMLSSAGTCLLIERQGDRAAPASSTAMEAERTDPVAAFRTQREELRARQRAQLNDIIYNPDTDAATVAQAQSRLMAMLDEESSEETLEGLLAARGYEGALVTVSTGAVNVLVRASSLDRAQTASILQLVTRQTGVGGGNVRILPIE